MEVPLSRSRILVVEDNPVVGESLVMLLEMMGHQVALASTGRQALQEWSDFAPDLVLCDLGLPDITGFEVARSIVSQANGGRPYLVALTAFGPETEAATREAGFDLHVTKPMRSGDLERIARGYEAWRTSR